MISYMPLVATLKKKKMNISMLQEKLGKQDNFLKKCLNEKRYISLKTVDEICTVLNCKIEDVIKWESGEQIVSKVEKYAEINWSVFDATLTRYGISLGAESRRQGHSSGWLSGLRRRGNMPKAVLRNFCLEYGIEYESMLKE